MSPFFLIKKHVYLPFKNASSLCNGSEPRSFDMSSFASVTILARNLFNGSCSSTTEVLCFVNDNWTLT